MEHLIKTTLAYKIFSTDRKSGRLSHAYCLVCNDELALPIYLRAFAKLVCCGSGEGYCNQCRTCRLIDKDSYVDVSVYPKGATKISVADINELVSQTFVKPLENDKHVFIVQVIDSMNESAQNKLLKTLEEPPESVVIIIGVTNEFMLLNTIKSRVKRLEIPPFSHEQLISCFEDKLLDKQRLKSAVELADGKAGYVQYYYENEASAEYEKLVFDVLLNMKSSRDLVSYSAKLNKDNLKNFLSVAKSALMQLIKFNETAGAALESCDIGRLSEVSRVIKTEAAVNIIQKINQAEFALAFNGNSTMVADTVLLGILEEKYKWQK